MKNKDIRAKDDFNIYKAKDFLLSRTEKNIYDKLVSILNRYNRNLIVFPKIKLVDFIWTPKGNPNAYLRIQSKFVDFLIVELPALKPKMAVFLINFENKPKMQSLNIIEPTLNSADIRLVKLNPKELEDGDLFEIITEALNGDR